MRLDVLARKLVQVRTLAQSDLLGFCLRVFDFTAIAQHAPDHPERADTDRAGTVNERGTVLGVVSDLQKLVNLFVFRIAKRDGDVEVAETQLFRLRFFFSRAMLARLTQVDDRFHAFGFELLELFEARLSAGAKLLVDAQKVFDRREIVLRGNRRDEDQRGKEQVEDFHARHITSTQYSAPLICADEHAHYDGRIRQQHRQPRAPPVDVFGEIKHARRKIDQQCDEAQKEEQPKKLRRPGWPAEIRGSKKVPDDLKQNHVDEDADVAECLALRLTQELGTRRFLRRREVTINEISLQDREDESEEDRRDKDRAAVHCLVTKQQLQTARDDGGNENQVQTEVEDGIEEATRNTGESRIEVGLFALCFQTLVKMPTLQHGAARGQSPHRDAREEQRELCERLTVVGIRKQGERVTREPPHQEQVENEHHDVER